MIPYIKQKSLIGERRNRIREHIEKAFFLPEDLSIVECKTRTRHRGILMWLSMNLDSNKSEFQSLILSVIYTRRNGSMEGCLYDFGITDLRGISDTLLFMGGKPFNTEPSNSLGLPQKLWKRKTELYGTTNKLNLFHQRNYDQLIGKQRQFKKDVFIKLNLKGAGVWICSCW